MIPLYYQIETSLKKKILRGELEDGSLLPTENQLAKQFQVSRITIRKALRSLDEEGVIIRKRGKGTFVSLDRELEPANLTGSIGDILSIGLKTTIKLLDFSRVVPNIMVTDYLGLPKGTQVYRIEKLRLLKGSPFSYVQNYVPIGIGDKIPIDLVRNKSLTLILEDNLHIDLTEAIQYMNADTADNYIAPLLEIKVGDPVLNIERTVYDIYHKPVEYLSIYYRVDKYRCKVRLVKTTVEDSPNWKVAAQER
ncbi:GntR family transcriptional regulator [Chloroflexota bacterium]